MQAPGREQAVSTACRTEELREGRVNFEHKLISLLSEWRVGSAASLTRRTCVPHHPQPLAPLAKEASSTAEPSENCLGAGGGGCPCPSAFTPEPRPRGRVPEG